MRDQTLEKDQIRQNVRGRYAEIAKSGPSCCKSSCCSSDALGDGAASAKVGYSQADMDAAPEGSNLGLGCGNPQAIAALRPGEVVLDLGSGGGFDCFLAARQIGGTGHVIGVDMTPEMLSKARENATKGGYVNVEFRLGEIEHLPVADNSVDVIMSNCVINLSPDKPQVYAEAARVLRRGGRVAVSDVVAVKPMPQRVKADLSAHACCVAGAAQVDELRSMLAAAGFVDVQINVNEASKEFIKEWFPGTGFEEYVRSSIIEARKG